MVKETIKIFLQTLIGLIIISFIAFVSHKFFNFIVSFSSEDDGIRQAPFIATFFLGFLSGFKNLIENLKINRFLNNSLLIRGLG